MDRDHDRHTPSDADLGMTIVFVIVLIACVLMWSGGTRFFWSETSTSAKIDQPAPPPPPSHM